VLRDGRHISTRPVGEVHRDLLVREMVGRSIEEEYPRRKHVPGPALLQVQEFSAPRRLKDVTFEVREGEVFAVTGLVGSGKSSLGKALFGCVPNAKGDIRVGTTPGPFASPREAKRAGVAFLPEDRKAEGLLLERSVQENLALAHLGDVSRYGIVVPQRERCMAARAMEEFGVVAAHREMAAGALSGGNQQKVMIARWLQKRYRVIILDEPTRGVDVGAKTELYALINRMSAEGAAIVLITSELVEAIGMADRIGVMNKGRLVETLDVRADSVTQERLLELAVA